MIINDPLHPFRADIRDVQRRIALGTLERIIRHDGDLEDNIFPLDLYIRPGLVLTVSRLFRGVCDQVLSLAGLVQLIFLARRLHGTVSESFWGRKPRAILLGDYCYSRFFALAASSGLQRFIRPLAEVVCLMGEGGIERCRTRAGEPVVLETLRKEAATLFGEACRCAGDLVGAKLEQQQVLYRFGVRLGMGYSLLQTASSHPAIPYLTEARVALTRLPKADARDVLENLLDYLVTLPLGPVNFTSGVSGN